MLHLVANLFVFPVLLALCCVGLRHGLSWSSLVNATLFPALMLASVAVHEAGHALAARAVGLTVLRIELGMGRRVWRGRLGRTDVVLNAFPVLGLTFCGAASERALRTRFWFLVAGGPAITAALVVLLWPPTSSPWQVVLPLEAFAHRIAPRELLVFFNLWLLAFNLLPVPLLVRNLGMVNDGTRLLTIPFSRQDEARDLLDSAVLLDATERVERRDFAGARERLDEALARRPASVHLRNVLGTVQLAEGEHAEARTTFLGLLRDVSPKTLSFWFIRNNVAWTDFLLRREELRAEADEHSAAAYARLKNVPAIVGTRGAVLVWLDRSAEAVPLLERAFVATGAPPNRANVACTLVLGFTRLGDRERAARWLARAEENDPHCALLSEARAALAPPLTAPTGPAAIA
ncbi:site-2 protease family protein [Pyxidicoccus sp. MSG2]|uniref:site-2 protease family protein n=1 Tax=Pyxidicoccus sp. MSG2 TaxID=2996790 RepID=UPI00226FD3AD|nr:site-2 protease family protein [Pyxidicoccus sp. MSG2]MCY1016098.1 site-2 protease family protein [Pyxidicoccus sp. MSG2]